MTYYYTDRQNKAQGPVSVEELLALQAAGQLPPDCQVVPLGGVSWQPLITVLQPRAVSSAGTEQLAIWSLVMGVLSIVCCGIFLSVPAVICGHMALGNINRNPALGGRGLAIAGLVLGYLVSAGWLIYFGIIFVVIAVGAVTEAAAAAP